MFVIRKPVQDIERDALPRRVQNRLLELLPEPERAVLLSGGELVNIRPRQVLHHWRLPMQHAYFIESGLISVSARIGPERFVEVWLIGSEGMVGAPLLLAERDHEPPHRRVVQVGGRALRIPATQFSDMARELPALRAVVLRYLNVVLLQTSQSGACNSIHPLKQRLARWLLVARSSSKSDELQLTHGVLGELLGVRRASVTECLNELETERIVQNARGVITIIQPGRLQQICCNCFTVIQSEYQRQLSPSAR